MGQIKEKLIGLGIKAAPAAALILAGVLVSNFFHSNAANEFPKALDAGVGSSMAGQPFPTSNFETDVPIYNATSLILSLEQHNAADSYGSQATTNKSRFLAAFTCSAALASDPSRVPQDVRLDWESAVTDQTSSKYSDKAPALFAKAEQGCSDVITNYVLGHNVALIVPVALPGQNGS
jgi:hypothetical protein